MMLSSFSSKRTIFKMFSFLVSSVQASSILGINQHGPITPRTSVSLNPLASISYLSSLGKWKYERPIPLYLELGFFIWSPVLISVRIISQKASSSRSAFLSYIVIAQRVVAYLVIAAVNNKPFGFSKRWRICKKTALFDCGIHVFLSMTYSRHIVIEINRGI